MNKTSLDSVICCGLCSWEYSFEGSMCFHSSQIGITSCILTMFIGLCLVSQHSYKAENATNTAADCRHHGRWVFHKIFMHFRCFHKICIRDTTLVESESLTKFHHMPWTAMRISHMGYNPSHYKISSPPSPTGGMPGSSTYMVKACLG